MTDTINIKPEEKQEDPNHVDEMVAKAEGNTLETEDKQAEELLAGKYKTEEDLQKGILELLKKDKGEEVSLEQIYKDLESEVLTPKEDKNNTVQTTIPEEEKEEDIEDLQKQKDESNIDFTKYEQEFFNNGELSEDSYKELEEQGFSKDVINRYIEGTQALAEKQAQEVFEVVGGEEEYQKVIEWAGDNLTDEEKQIYNQAVESGNISQAKFAVEALYGRYNRNEGQKPSVIQGKTPQTNTSAKFNSRQEVTEAMNNPKYQTDPAFRAEVIRKLKNSNVF